MDMSKTIQPRSDQLNADDLLAGPVDVTIAGVITGKAEQPVDIELEEYPGRVFRPGVTMRRVLVHAWGKDSDAYIGRRMRLYCDPTVRFGKEVVGGIRISHLSDISKRLEFPVTVTRGRRQPYTVQPLTTPAPVPVVTPERVAAAASEAELKAMWRQTQDPQARAAIQQRVAELRAQVTPLPDTDTDPETAA